MDTTVYFEQGQVVKMEPEPNCSYYEARGMINNAKNIVSDGVHYDLTDRDSIYSIAVPEYTYSHKNFHAQDLGVTGYLDYVLRMHSGLLWNQGEYILSLICLGKACQLMLYSTIGWQRKDYYRIVNWNIELGRFKKAQEWKDWIEKYTPNPMDVAVDSFNRTVNSCSFLRTDLVEVGDLGGLCKVCAKYRNRIYSLSGKTIKFPKFPKDFHYGCGLSIYPFIDGVSEPTFKCKNYILHSWRPFIDDRTPLEIENYKKRLELLSGWVEPKPNLNHIIYYWFKPKFPNDFPKTVGGFSRMRNANSKSYQKLMEKVAAAGYKIPQSLEEVAKWDEENNQPKVRMGFNAKKKNS